MTRTSLRRSTPRTLFSSGCDFRRQAGSSPALCIGIAGKFLFCADRRVVAAWMLMASLALSTAGPATNGNALQAEVFSISEYRGSPGRCMIGIKLSGDALTNKLSLLKTRVIRAVDDLGTNLTPPGRQEPTGAGTSGGFTIAALRGWHELRPTKTRFASIELPLASRRAQTITELQGEVELYSPTLDNGGVVVIEHARRHPGELPPDATLEKFGVTFSWVTKESYEAGRTPAGRGGTPPANFQVESLFPGILGEPGSAPRNYLVLKMGDPQKRVTSFAFQEPSGRLLPVRQTRRAEDMVGFYFDMVVPEDLTLYVYLAVPEAVEVAPFELRNVHLP